MYSFSPEECLSRDGTKDIFSDIMQSSQSIYCLEVATSTLKDKHIWEQNWHWQGDHCCHHFGDIVEVVKVQAGLVGRNEVVLNVDIETDKAAGQWVMSHPELLQQPRLFQSCVPLLPPAGLLPLGLHPLGHIPGCLLRLNLQRGVIVKVGGSSVAGCLVIISRDKQEKV